MRLMYQWLGAEIVFVHVGHGLLGAGVVVILALHVPLWFTLAIAPLIVFSLWGWSKEASLVMPVAHRYLSGNPFPPISTATTGPGGADSADRDGVSGQTTAAPAHRTGQVKT